MKSSSPMTSSSISGGAQLTSPVVDDPSAVGGPLAVESLHDDDARRLEAEVDAFGALSPTLTAAHWHRVHARCAPFGPAVARLLDEAAASDGGKHLRPRLVAAAYLGFGGSDQRLLAEVAGAQQLLHLGLCLHDDLIDGDRMRHGRPNLLAAYEAADRSAGITDAVADRQAAAAGLLAGDLALNAALLALLAVPAPVSVQHRLAAEAATALERTIAGEVLDVRSELLRPDVADPLRVAELKTAVYSVSLPLRLGAIAAGETSARVVGSLDRAGLAFGIAYQLADDDLGLFGAAAVTGKSVLSDVRQGTRTEHVRLAYASAGPADRAALDRVLGMPSATDRDADVVREIVLRTGARDAVTRTIDEHVARGIRTAESDLPAPLATYLTRMARSMRSRTR
jgi:geranylgeranyl diphosphate synthase type I